MSDKPILERKFDEKIDADRYVKEGRPLAVLYLEMQGNNRIVIENALKSTIEKMMNEPNINLVHVKLYDIEKQEPEDDTSAEEKKQEVFSGIVEVKLFATEFRWLLDFVLRYGPTAIEVISPDSIVLSSDQIHSILADASSISQSLSSQILYLLKDPERKRVYDEMIK